MLPTVIFTLYMILVLYQAFEITITTIHYHVCIIHDVYALILIL